MQHRKFFKIVSITLGLCGGSIIIPTLASCSVQQTRQPSIKESINLNIKFSDLLTTNESPTNGANSKAVPAATTEVLKTPKQLFEEKFKKYPQEFINNYDVLTQDQAANLKLETTAKNTNDNFNDGSMTYEQWSKKSSTTVTPNKKATADMPIEKVYYPNDGSYFTVSSPKELHKKLDKDITNIFEKIQGKPTENKMVTYTLNDKSKIGYTKNDDLLHVNVIKTETTPDQPKELNKATTETQYDLCIPTSSVFFFVKSDTLKVTYMKEENTLLDLSRGTTYLNFDIGIQGQAMSEKFTKENLMIGTKQQLVKTGTTQININTVLTALGWIKKEEVSAKIFAEIRRGATEIKSTGMYTHHDKSMILCLINKYRAPALRRIVADIDPNAFVFSTNVNEVIGKGFFVPTPKNKKKKASKKSNQLENNSNENIVLKTEIIEDNEIKKTVEQQNKTSIEQENKTETNITENNNNEEQK